MLNRGERVRDKRWREGERVVELRVILAGARGRRRPGERRGSAGVTGARLGVIGLRERGRR